MDFCVRIKLYSQFNSETCISKIKESILLLPKLERLVFKIEDLVNYVFRITRLPNPQSIPRCLIHNIKTVANMVPSLTPDNFKLFKQLV
jgi:hypothetical protein